MTLPEVFIIESLEIKNEIKDQYEGKILHQFLTLMGKKPIYYYIKSKMEFEKLIDAFYETEYRYLHISAHGSNTGMSTTYDKIDIDELASILEAKLDKRRLFLSACSLTTETLAEKIFGVSSCNSIVGPDHDIYFSDAAVAWTSFYNLMFKENDRAMKGNKIKENLELINIIYELNLVYYSKNSKAKKGYTKITT